MSPNFMLESSYSSVGKNNLKHICYILKLLNISFVLNFITNIYLIFSVQVSAANHYAEI